MPDLEPVAGDPFATQLMPVSGDPFASMTHWPDQPTHHLKTQPVSHDPFANNIAMPLPILGTIDYIEEKNAEKEKARDLGVLMPMLYDYPTGNEETSAPFSERMPPATGNVEDRTGLRQSGYEHMLAGNQMIRAIARAIIGADPMGGYPITYDKPPIGGTLQKEAGIEDIGKVRFEPVAHNPFAE